MPQAAAGMRIEPPVSVPSVASAMPAATLTADPPLEPPGDRDGSCGLRAGPNAESSLVVPNANSCRFVLPTKTAPAWRRCAIAGASRAATWPSRTRDAAVVGTPRTSSRSLIEIGTPCSGPRSMPGGELAIGLARLPPRLVGHDEDERVQARVVGLDAPQALVGHLGRADLAGAQPAAELVDGHHARQPARLALAGDVDAARVVVEVGGPQRARRLREGLEHGFSRAGRAARRRRGRPAARLRWSSVSHRTRYHMLILIRLHRHASSPRSPRRRAAARSPSSAADAR